MHRLQWASPSIEVGVWRRAGAIALATAVGFIALLAGARAENVLRIITTGDYPPFVYTGANGTLVGFEIDIADAVCAVLSARCQFTDLPFEEVIPALVAGRGDVIVASLSITAERKKLVAFTNRYYRNPMQFVARKGFDRPITPEGLKGLKIGVTPETTAEAYTRKIFGAAAEIVSIGGVNEQDDLYAALSAGKVDLILSDSLPMWHFTVSAEGRGVTFVGAPIYVDEEIGMAVRKEDDSLRERLNAAIARIRLDGTYQKINAKYFPFSIY
jgi:ABC-type amino acid transport substrate-binding protein